MIETHDFELTTYASTPAMEALYASEIGNIVQTSSAEWFGVASVANLPGVIATVLRNGDLTTTERVADAVRACKDLSLPPARSLKPVWLERQHTGTRLNLTAALAGQPRAWGRFERQRSAGPKTVAVYLPSGGTGGYSAAEMSWGPVAAIVVIDLLESAGYRCEAWVASKVGLGGDSVALRAPLKRAEDPSDLHAISRVAHATFHRGLVMPVRYLLSNGRCGSDYGHTQPVEPGDFGDDSAIAIRHTYSLDAAVAEINRVIKLFSEV